MQSLSVLARKVRTFASINSRLKLRFIQAYIYTGVARAFILFVPFNKIKNRMGNLKKESEKEVDIASYRIAKNVSWAVTQASRHTPWESKCLVQALTARRMMKERGVSTTLYLGVMKNEKNEMIAHAWIRCGSYYITGGVNRTGYAVVAKFSS
ncbi:lasso peptide biosynthesis B2 protein [Clostridium sp.]|uniref:lasso peptide biosynthesis B2 protein n=1 Tax=Clostridium sp. TaxID=1506 RepID=UPI003216CA76